MSCSPIDSPDAPAAHSGVPTRLFIGWDSTHLAWHLSDDAGQTHGRTRLDALHAPRLWHPTLPQTLREVHVIASHRVAVHWTQVPADGLRSLDELRQAAAARCVMLFGGGLQDWWLAADWQASRPFVCAALHRNRMGQLEHALREQRLQWHWHTAATLMAQSPPAPRDGWVAARSPRRLLLWHQFEGLADAALNWPIAPDTSASYAETLVREGQLRLTMAQRHGPQEVHWLTGSGPEEANEEAEAALATWRWIR